MHSLTMHDADGRSRDKNTADRATTIVRFLIGKNMPIYKRCGRCGGRLLAGNTCSCFSGKFSQRTYADRHKYYDATQRDLASRAFYHSAEWLQTREDVLALDNYADLYLLATEGKVEAADTVHHITPLREDYNRRCDRDNLISLSAQTHSMIEQEYAKGEPEKRAMQEKLYEIVRQKRA